MIVNPIYMFTMQTVKLAQKWLLLEPFLILYHIVEKIQECRLKKRIEVDCEEKIATMGLNLLG